MLVSKQLMELLTHNMVFTKPSQILVSVSSIHLFKNYVNIQKFPNKDLLYNIGNSAQYSVIT